MVQRVIPQRVSGSEAKTRFWRTGEITEAKRGQNPMSGHPSSCGRAQPSPGPRRRHRFQEQTRWLK
eukprot:294123-Pyramimonas_sp.AAC.1